MSRILRRKFLRNAALGSLGAFSYSLVGSTKQPSDSAQDSGWNEVSRILQRIYPPTFPNRVFPLTDYEAKANGKADCRLAILTAIDLCSAAGGGQVLIPAGTWRVDGPIHLKSNVNLHLADGATIDFNPDPKLYLPIVLTRWEGTELYNYSPFIYAYRLRNIAITGNGILNGNAKQSFATWKSKEVQSQQQLRQMGRSGVPLQQRIFGAGYWLRPSMVQLFGCRNVIVDGITILDSPFWCVHPVYSQNVTVRNLRVDSRNSNNDGVDPDSSVDVLIENCIFNTGDDSIAIKSGRDQDGWRVGKPSQNIIVRNCKLNARRNGLCIGSEMSGGVRNVFIDNCQVGKVVSGIYFKSNRDRGGVVEQVRVRNVTVAEADIFIQFTTNYPGEHVGHFSPTFRDVVINNVTCQQARKGIDAIGKPDAPLRNIVLRDVAIQQAQEPYDIQNVQNFDLQNVVINGERVSLTADKQN